MSTEKKRKLEEGDSKETPILYSYWRSSCSWRVRIALAVKDISYEYRAINLLSSDHTTAEYLALNPMKEVPLLVYEGRGVAQSLPIIEYLEELFPKPSIFPADRYQRAKSRQLAEIIASDTQPVQNLRVLNMIKAKLGEDEKTAWAKFWITNGLTGFESEVAKTMGRFCVGDEVSLADCALVPQLYNARRFGVDLSAFPNCLRIEAELNKLPAVMKAHPDNQPDAVKEQPKKA